MSRFKNIKELNDYIENNCFIVKAESEGCYICGQVLHNMKGDIEYHLCEEYAPDEKFCSEECIKEFLLNKIGVEDNE